MIADRIKSSLLQNYSTTCGIIQSTEIIAHYSLRWGAGCYLGIDWVQIDNIINTS